MPYNQHGSYLISYSKTNPNQYVLSLRDGERVRHYRIQQREDGAFFLSYRGSGIHFKTIAELVTYYQHQTRGLPVKLIHHCIVWGEYQTVDQLNQKWEIDRSQLKLVMKLWEGEVSKVWEVESNEFLSQHVNHK